MKTGFNSTFENVFLAAAVLLFLAGCATMSNDISIAKMKPKERVYAGQIEVTINGERAKKCEIYLNMDIAPSIKLAQDEIIVYKTDREKLKLRSIACYDSLGARLGAWHHHDLNLKGLLRPENRSQLTYFGKIKLDWTVDRELAKEEAVKIVDVTSLVKEGHVKDSGELVVQVISDQKNILDFLEKNLPEYKTKNLEVVENLVAKDI